MRVPLRILPFFLIFPLVGGAEDAAVPTAPPSDVPEKTVETAPEATDTKGNSTGEVTGAKDGKTGKEEKVSASSGLNAARLLPIGVPCCGVRMPNFESDLLISQIRVRELTRIDDQHLDMRDMELERYRPDGELDYVVTVERGFYDMVTGRLVSDTPTRLRGKAFDLQGEGCDYARDAPVIKILGNITSYIYPSRVEPEKKAEAEAEPLAENSKP